MAGVEALSWADTEDELVKSAVDLSLDVDGAPDLHSGELVVREAGCAEGQHNVQAVTSFAALPIDESVKNAIAKVKGWQTMSKIQQIGLPLILRDPPANLIGQAQAGTGKTGTFVIGLLSRITAEKKPSSPQAIILAITQELVSQIAQELNSLGSEKGISARRVMSAHNKVALEGADPAPWMLKEGEDFDEQVVVGTPGMVKNYLKNATGRKKRKPCIETDDVKVLVLDEADKMLMQMESDIIEIRNMISKKRKDQVFQMLLFSATYSEEMKRLARDFVGTTTNDLSKYHEITLNKKDVTLDKVVNFYILVGDENERDEERLYTLKAEKISDIWRELTNYNLGQTVIFCERKDRVQKITEQLRSEGFNVGQIHGDMNKTKRDEVLNEFKKGERTALVSTNLTSRGIDNPNVTLVINVDLPIDRNGDPDPSTFVHRIGRSGRWTKKGASVSLVARSPKIKDLAIMKGIEQALFANQEVNRPLLRIDKVEDLGVKIQEELGKIN